MALAPGADPPVCRGPVSRGVRAPHVMFVQGAQDRDGVVSDPPASARSPPRRPRRECWAGSWAHDVGRVARDQFGWRRALAASQDRHARRRRSLPGARPGRDLPGIGAPRRRWMGVRSSRGWGECWAIPHVAAVPRVLLPLLGDEQPLLLDRPLPPRHLRPGHDGRRALPATAMSPGSLVAGPLTRTSSPTACCGAGGCPTRSLTAAQSVGWLAFVVTLGRLPLWGLYALLFGMGLAGRRSC